MKLKARLRDSQSGQAAVEMALLLPVLVLVFLAILELGRVLDAWVIATNAAREGARYAAFGESAGSVNGRVSSYLGSGLASRTDVTPAGTTVSGAQGTPGTPVQVTVQLNVRIFTPWMSDLGFTDPLPVRGMAIMRLQ